MPLRIKHRGKLIHEFVLLAQTRAAGLNPGQINAAQRKLVRSTGHTVSTARTTLTGHLPVPRRYGLALANLTRR